MALHSLFLPPPPSPRYFFLHKRGIGFQILRGIFVPMLCTAVCSWHIVTFLPREYHGQRSLAGYSLRGCKESDMTEWLSHSFPAPPSCLSPTFHYCRLFLLQSITLYVTEINILKQKLDYGNPSFQSLL